MKLRTILLGSACLGITACADIPDIGQEILELCEKPEAAELVLCNTPSFAEDLATFCDENPEKVVCTEPASLISFCLKNPELSFCGASENISLETFCNENPQINFCQSTDNVFMINPHPQEISNQSQRKGNFLALDGSQVHYEMQTTLDTDGRTITEIVFPDGLKPGTLIEGVTAKMVLGVVPSKGSVDAVYFNDYSFHSLLKEEIKQQKMCDTVSVKIRYVDDGLMGFTFVDLDGNIVAETSIAQGDYDIVSLPDYCPIYEQRFMVGNLGNSYFLGSISETGDLSVIAGPSDCYTVLPLGSDQKLSFFTPGSEKDGDGRLRHFEVFNRAPYTKLCQYMYYYGK